MKQKTKKTEPCEYGIFTIRYGKKQIEGSDGWRYEAREPMDEGLYDGENVSFLVGEEPNINDKTRVWWYAYDVRHED